MSMPSRNSSIFSITVIVAALGYFVDIYDLILFSIVRVASLKELGLSGDDLTTQGLFLINTTINDGDQLSYGYSRVVPYFLLNF